MRMIHDWRFIKKRHSYKAQELADVLGIGHCAVYRWLKRGLPQIGKGRPALIRGEDAIAFLQRLHASYKRPCGVGELHCLRCRTGRKIANNVAEVAPFSSQCGCSMHQIVRIDRLSSRLPGVQVRLIEAKGCNHE
jgi:hypothetical protein